METFGLSPDGRKSIGSYRSLEAAIERAQILLTSRPDVQQFRIVLRHVQGRPAARGHREPSRGYRPAWMSRQRTHHNG
jgi:hypothetical protein